MRRNRPTESSQNLRENQNHRYQEEHRGEIDILCNRGCKLNIEKHEEGIELEEGLFEERDKLK